MKTISIDELHERTGQFVQLAAREDIVVVDQGQPRAVLKRFPEAAAVQAHWQERERALAGLPMLGADSTAIISEDRDGR
jgi:hypothetical protein